MASAAPPVNAAKSEYPALSPDWQRSLFYLSFAVMLISALFWRDIADMARIAWNVSTYNHILLVAPILAWLVWQRVPLLLMIAPRIWWPGLVILTAAGACWMLGYAAGLSVARQLAVIMMLQGSVIALLGPSVTRGLIFPLAYAFFLLPIGEEMVPFLQTVTADMSMVLLEWSGIPAHIEGVFITTPTGYFEVAEACSGVKFLIAMIAYGALVSNLCYKSWLRRIAFMIVSVIVPVVANGVRAWGTMYIAHYRGIAFAASFDHIFYGWIFFAAVLVIVMAIGWRFFDRSIDDPAFDVEAARALESIQQPSSRAALGATYALIALPMLWTFVAAQPSAILPDGIDLPQVAGWQRVEYSPAYPWRPRFDGANYSLLGSYFRADGLTVDVAIGLYDGQAEGREITGYGQGAHDPASGWSWAANGDAVEYGRSDIFAAPGPVVREAVTYYRIGDMLTGSGVKVKLEIMKARLSGQPQSAMTIIVSAENGKERSGRAAINAFLSDIGPVDKWADRIVAVR